MMSDRRRLYIHIGTGKTGTTALQRFFASNRTGLARNGLVYPEIGTFVQGQAHHILSHKWGGWIPQHRLAGRDAIVEWHELKRLIETGKQATKYLISSEQFAAASCDTPDMLGFIANLLRDVDIRILVYLRPQDELADAVYRQSVKAGLTVDTAEQFVGRLPKYFDYSDLLSRWSATFGIDHLIVRRYCPSDWESGDIVDDALEAIGVTWSDDFRRTGYRNESISAAAARLLVDLNLRAHPRFDALKKALFRALPRHHADDLFDGPQRAAIMERYKASNKRVAELFFQSEHSPLFPEKCAPENVAVGRRISLSYDGFRNILAEFRGPDANGVHEQFAQASSL